MQRFINFVKDFDRYGKVIGEKFTYKGSDEYKTLFGLFITLANILFAAEFVFVTIYDTYNRTAFSSTI